VKVMDALRRRLPAFDFNSARRYLCSVWGLSLALDARWPVRDPQAGPRDGGVTLNVHAGGDVASPMAGRVEWIGRNGRRGLCVEIDHGCELRSTLCGLSNALVRTGERVRPGTPVGKASPASKDRPVPWFGLTLESYLLDPRVLKEERRDGP
jgi:hypothetical protein